ncbi:AraC family transcriptional regulator [Lachnospiraceae bacterium 54-53]
MKGNIEETVSVSRKKQANHTMPDNHFHSTYEVYYLLEGERKFFIKDRTVVIKAGDLVIIHPNVLHRTADGNHSEHEKIILNFKEEFMPGAEGEFFQKLHPGLHEDYLVIHFSHHLKIIGEELLLQIVEEAQVRKAAYREYIQSLIIQLLILSSRYLEEHAMEPFEYLTPMHERISEVVRYINDHYKGDLSLQYLADKFYVSPFYLSRAFKEVTGFTFVEYVNSVRVKEAKKLLEETNLKVYLIAAKAGYGSITHFGRVFKEITGHAPLYYRRKN